MPPSAEVLRGKEEGREVRGRRDRRDQARDDDVECALTPSLVGSPLSPSLRFQRESRVYEERVPSHSVFGEEFGGEPASSKSNTANQIHHLN